MWSRLKMYMQIDLAVLDFDLRILCPLNAGGLIPLYDSHWVGGKRPPSAGAFFTNSTCLRRFLSLPFGVVGVVEEHVHL